MKRVIGFVFFNALAVFAVGLSAQGIDGMLADQIGNQVARFISAGISKNLADNLIIPQLKIRNESGEVIDFSVSPDTGSYCLLHKDGSIRVWDAKLGIQRPAIFAGGKTLGKVICRPSANLVLAGAGDGLIMVYDALTGREIRKLPGHSQTISALASSGNEKILVSADTNGTMIVWDLDNMARIKVIDTEYGEALKLVAVDNAGKILIAAGDDGLLDIWDIEKGVKIQSLPAQSSIKGIGLAEALARVITVNDESVLESFDMKTGRELFNLKLAGEDLLAVAVDTHANRLAIATESKTIKLFDLTTFAPLKDFKASEEIGHLKLINNGRQLLGADGKGILHVWDTATAHELLKLISTDSGWTVVDDKGRFDSSEAGMKNVSWDAASQDIPLDSFSANYYEPGLLATTLGEDRFINARPKAVQSGITLPPEVKISPAGADGTAGQDFIVTMTVIDAGGGIGDLRFYHNGKIADKSAIVESVDSEVNGKPVRRVSYKTKPGAGLNQFKAIAANTMGIDGQAQELSVDFKGEAAPTTLHVVVVGINHYQDSRLNLNYSVADAELIVSLLGDKTRVPFTNIVRHEIFDRHATKEGILSQLKKIAGEPQNDAMVIYLAGHGIAVDGKWYFLPYETQFQDDEQYYARVGISAGEIRDLMAAIPLQKVIIMVDSCYSGAGLNAFRNLQNTQRHFSRSLSKLAGIVVLAATRRDQQAAELTDLGHGLFTYVVTQGMRGDADSRPKDQKISAHEVVSFSTETIPSFSRKYLGASQEPTAFTWGSDFDLLGRN